jgi:RecA-family ATPase
MLGPRLAAAGADLNRIHIPNSRWVLNRTNLVEKLESEIKKIQYLRALILDPITSVLSISRNNADDVRAVLTGLGNLAARYGIAIIAVVHLNKSGRGQAFSQVSGSFEWTAACRAAFLVTHDSDGGRHLVAEQRRSEA